MDATNFLLAAANFLLQKVGLSPAQKNIRKALIGSKNEICCLFGD